MIAGSGIRSTVGSNISFVFFRLCSHRRSCFFSRLSSFNDRRKKRKRQKSLNRETERRKKAKRHNRNRTPKPKKRKQKNRNDERRSEHNEHGEPQDRKRHGGAPRQRPKEEQAPPNGTQRPPKNRRKSHEREKSTTRQNTSRSNSDDNGTTAAARQRLKFAVGQGQAPPRVLPRLWQTRHFHLKNDLHYHCFFICDHFFCFLRRYAGFARFTPCQGVIMKAPAAAVLGLAGGFFYLRAAPHSRRAARLCEKGLARRLSLLYICVASLFPFSSSAPFASHVS